MGYRDYSTAKGRIVDTTGHGDFTTIQAAINAASSGQTVFIRPGTYTENLTLKTGVNLCAYAPIGGFGTPSVGNVIISGKCSYSSAGNVALFGLTLQTNSDYAVEVTGSAASIVVLDHCYINCTNNTGMNMASTSASALIGCSYCGGDLTTTGIALFSNSGAGNIRFLHSSFGNSGGSSTNNTCSSTGNFFPNYSSWANGCTFSSSSTISGDHLDMVMAGNQTALTFTGTSGAALQYCTIVTGSATAVSIGSGCSATFHHCLLGSSNGTTVSGSGTFGYSNCVFNSVYSIASTIITSPNPGTDGWRFISAQTASASSALNFTNITGPNTVFNKYMLVFEGLLPSVNGVQMNVLYSTNNGSSYVSSGYQCAVDVNRSGVAYHGEFTTVTSAMPVCQASSFGTSSAASGYAIIANAKYGNSRSASYVSNVANNGNIGAAALYWGFGNLGNTAAVNAFQVAPASGTFSGYVTLYGLV